nr:ATP synthase subunit f, mitochondrial-like [Saimiri boliviensis boliviensis]
MASVVPLKDRKLLEVKLGELPSWVLMRDFSLSGIVGAFRRGYHRCCNKYINVKKGSIAGLTTVLACCVVFNYTISYKELKHERRCNTTEEDKLCTPVRDLLGLSPSIRNTVSIIAESFHILMELTSK